MKATWTWDVLKATAYTRKWAQPNLTLRSTELEIAIPLVITAQSKIFNGKSYIGGAGKTVTMTYAIDAYSS